MIPFANNIIYRHLLGWAMPPKISLLKVTMPKVIKNAYNRMHIFQDLLIPFEKFEETVDFMDKKVNV